MRTIDPDAILVDVLGIASASLASVLRDEHLLVAKSQNENRLGLQHLATLARANRDLWDAETMARNPDISDVALGQMKRKIDDLNGQRLDRVEAIDSLFREALRDLHSPNSTLLHDSPGQILDRLSIECWRACVLSHGLDDRKKSELLEATDGDIEALTNRLWEIIDTVISGKHIFRATIRKRLYSPSSMSTDRKAS